MEAKLRRLKETHSRWTREYEFLAAELVYLAPASAPSFRAPLKDTEELPAPGLIHRLTAGVKADTVRSLLPLLGARMDGIAATVGQRAHLFPELAELLAAEWSRLSQSPAAHQRHFVACHGDWLPADLKLRLIPGLAEDADPEVRAAAIQARAALGISEPQP